MQLGPRGMAKMAVLTEGTGSQKEKATCYGSWRGRLGCRVALLGAQVLQNTPSHCSSQTVRNTPDEPQ